MHDEAEDYAGRIVRAEIEGDSLEGTLRIHKQLRTLDDLNVMAKNFVTLHDPSAVRAERSLASNALTLNKAGILMLWELAPERQGTEKAFVDRFTREPVRVQLGDFEVQGFVHLPPGGDPMKRLDQDRHPFLALTTALVNGPHSETTMPFVAVNKRRIVAAQRIRAEDSDHGMLTETAGAAIDREL